MSMASIATSPASLIVAKFRRGDFRNQEDVEKAAYWYYYKIAIEHENSRKVVKNEIVLDSLMKMGRKLYKVAHSKKSSQEENNIVNARVETSCMEKRLENCNLNKGTQPVEKTHLLQHKKHEALSTSQNSNHCLHCYKKFSTKKSMLRHMNLNICRHEIITFSCKICKKAFASNKNLQVHERNLVCSAELKGGPLVRRIKDIIEHENGVVERRSAFNKYLTDFEIPNTSNALTLKENLLNRKEILVSLIRNQLNEKMCIKTNMVLDCEFVNIEGEIINTRFKTGAWAVYQETDLNNHVYKAIEKMEKEMDNSVVSKSGWTLHSIGSIHLLVSKYQPIRGSSYLAHPSQIEKRKATVNPRNKDNRCFQWAVLAEHAVNLRNKNDTKHLKKYLKNYNFDCISFPTKISDIQKFEKINDLSINLFALDDDLKIYPVKVVDIEKARHRDLLIIQHEEMQHYIYISDFSRLVGSQISKHTNKKYICKRCMISYMSDAKLQSHKHDCFKNKPVKVEMPKSKNGQMPQVKFNQYRKQIPVPFTLTADFECAFKNIHTCENDPNQSATIFRQVHEPMSYGLLLQSVLPKYVTQQFTFSPEIYDGPYVAETFLRRVRDIALNVENVYNRNEKMRISSKQRKKYQKAKKCYLCNLPFTARNEKVRDHSHITGLYRGAAHNDCNINCKPPNFLPVLIHNLNYDSHFLITALHSIGGNVEVIPLTEENFISFSVYVSPNFKIQFLDTFRFMSTSLDNLAKYLPGDKFVNIAEHFPIEEQRNLALRKGVFCYDFVTSLEKLNLEHLPAKSDFYSKLTESDISDEDYEHAQNVWRTFNIKNLGEYSNLYLKIDVLLLADVFQNFREVSLETYKLDPCWYLTSPGLAWDAALKYTAVELDLLNDYDMLMMIERGIRGGITQCNKKYVEAKNKYTQPNEFSAVCETNGNYLLYIDANNLYGWAMSRKLPTGSFEWVNFDHSTEILKLEEDSDIGYIFEVDIHYPQHLHDGHNDLPFLPINEIPNGGKHTKLLTTLNDKEKYVVHYINLKQAMNAGLVVTKIHRTLKFKQSNWLQPYIDLNTHMRKIARNNFDKDFFKLMNNAVFGKTMENVRKRLRLKLITDFKFLRKWVANPAFKYRTIYNENLAAVLLNHEKVVMNKPIYVGFTILELSKTLMYDFFYIKVRNWYEDAALVYMDTDSFILEINTFDLYSDLAKNVSEFDFSDYDKKHICYSDINKKVLGKFKDEACSNIITHFVGLKPKMYAIRFKDHVIKKAKGIKNYALKKKIDFDHYVSCLNSSTPTRIACNMIRSEKHSVFTITQSKVSLTAVDDKRYILPCGVRTLAHGHYSI